MNTIQIIVTALAAGAVAALPSVADAAISDGYQALKALIKRKYATVDVEQLEKQPASKLRRDVVEEELTEVQADNDPELLQLAQRMLQVIEAQSPAAAQTIGLDLADIRACSLKMNDILAQGSGVKVKEVLIEGALEISGVRSMQDSGRPSISSTKKKINITRYTDIICPRQVWVETPRISIVVRLTIERSEYSEAVEEITGLTVAAPVQVYLTAPNLVILNDAQQETPILPEKDSPPIVFDLKPLHVGHTQLQFDFFQQGHPLRTVTIPIEITEQASIADSPHHIQQSVTTVGNTIPPDLILHIGWDKDNSRLTFTLIREGGASWREFTPVTLDSNPASHASEIYRRITSLVAQDDPTVAAVLQHHSMIPTDDVDRQIQQLGYHLWRTLLPVDLRQLYADERTQWRDRSLLIYSDEPHLPWELIWPYDDSKGTWKDDAPWCVTTQLTRWLRRDAQGNGNEAAPGTLFLRSAAVLSPQYQLLRNLPFAPVERDTIKALWNAHQVVDVSPSVASWSAVMDLLESGEGDWIHMASHGCFYAQAPTSDSAIWLDDDKALTPEHLGGPDMTYHFRQRRRAFVFNACEVGRQGWALTRIGGWANQLISLNCGLFIGPLWNVSDRGAAAFSGALYDSLLKGETVGKAVQQARLAARTAGDPTWLAYSVYAHPNARVSIETK